MTNRSKEWTDAKLKTRIQEGRGQGDKEYQPWLKVADTPSRGRVTRIFSRKMNRTMHLLSDMQTMYYYLLEFDDRVQFVKEQYPLMDLMDIVAELDEPLLKRLSNSDGTPHIVVTTFLVTAKDVKGNVYTFARSLKAIAELEKRAVLERLEIQRRYFNNLNIDWSIITEDEINYIKSRNIEWVLPALNILDYGIAEEKVKIYGPALIDSLLNNPSRSLNVLLESFERKMRLGAGTGLFLYRHFIASKQIEVNLDIELNIKHTPEMIGLTVR